MFIKTTLKKNRLCNGHLVTTKRMFFLFIYLFYFFYQIVLFGPVFGPGIAKKRVLQH